MNHRSEAKANSVYARLVADSPSASVGGWTRTRPGSLGLLPSGPDPVGERYVPRQPPEPYLDHAPPRRKAGSEAIHANADFGASTPVSRIRALSRVRRGCGAAFLGGAAAANARAAGLRASATCWRRRGQRRNRRERAG